MIRLGMSQLRWFVSHRGDETFFCCLMASSWHSICSVVTSFVQIIPKLFNDSMLLICSTSQCNWLVWSHSSFSISQLIAQLSLEFASNDIQLYCFIFPSFPKFKVLKFHETLSSHILLGIEKREIWFWGSNMQKQQNPLKPLKPVEKLIRFSSKAIPGISQGTAEGLSKRAEKCFWAASALLCLECSSIPQ